MPNLLLAADHNRIVIYEGRTTNGRGLGDCGLGGEERGGSDDERQAPIVQVESKFNVAEAEWK